MTILADSLLFISNLILMVSMIPQIIKMHKYKTTMSYTCCIMTILPLFGIFVSNIMIGYNILSVIPLLITLGCWVIILILSVIYKKENIDAKNI